MRSVHARLHGRVRGGQRRAQLVQAVLPAEHSLELDYGYGEHEQELERRLEALQTRLDALFEPVGLDAL